jgi:hypothetical protein
MDYTPIRVAAGGDSASTPYFVSKAKPGSRRDEGNTNRRRLASQNGHSIFAFRSKNY